MSRSTPWNDKEEHYCRIYRMTSASTNKRKQPTSKEPNFRLFSLSITLVPIFVHRSWNARLCFAPIWGTIFFESESVILESIRRKLNLHSFQVKLTFSTDPANPFLSQVNGIWWTRPTSSVIHNAMSYRVCSCIVRPLSEININGCWAFS